MDFFEVSYKFQQKQLARYMRFISAFHFKSNSQIDINLELIVFAKNNKKKLEFKRFKII